MLRFIRVAACVGLAMLASAASAQTYPSAPVKLIVPIPAGGVTDVMARVVGQRLQEMWGKPSWWKIGPAAIPAWARKRSSGLLPMD